MVSMVVHAATTSGDSGALDKIYETINMSVELKT